MNMFSHSDHSNPSQVTHDNNDASRTSAYTNSGPVDVQGKCHCGKLKWITHFPENKLPASFLCHCESCRKFGAGGYSVNAIIPKVRIELSLPFRFYPHFYLSSWYMHWPRVFRGWGVSLSRRPMLSGGRLYDFYILRPTWFSLILVPPTQPVEARYVEWMAAPALKVRISASTREKQSFAGALFWAPGFLRKNPIFGILQE